MKTFTKALAKGAITTIAAGAMVVSAASPALARDYRDHDGVSAGEVIAGALIIGGIAAIVASAGQNRDYSYDRAGYDNYGYENRDGYGRGRRSGSPRRAVEQCIAAAERGASRHSYGRADVTDIRRVRETGYGYEVRGRIAVNSRGYDLRNGDSNYGRGWGGDYRGWNNSTRGYDAGSFSCDVERGRVVDIDYSGIRALR